jgi:hypothetical protein
MISPKTVEIFFAFVNITSTIQQIPLSQIALSGDIADTRRYWLIEII